MICPQCGLEAIIHSVNTQIRGDDSPDTRTEIFRRMVFHCRNPRCKSFGKEIGEQVRRTFPAEEREEENEKA
jgi:hypothetical protein